MEGVQEEISRRRPRLKQGFRRAFSLTGGHATAYVGSDDQEGTFTMLYFDQRGVSRRYEVAMDGGVMHWWRDAPGFRQRYTLTVSADGETLQGRGELAREEDAWGPDLELTYTRET